MRKRSRYRPHGVNPAAHLMAIQGSCLLSLDDRTKWALALDSAVQAVRTGRASQRDWTEIFDAVNIIEQLVTMKLAQDPAGLVEAAQQACVDILDRQRSTGVRAARAAELSALQDLRAAWVELMDSITHHQRFTADQRVRRRVQAALAGGMPQARVVEAVA